ncbi:Undecaprenyl-phosphate+4-deoxy-4-formamido-L-arabinose+transferase [Methylocapsa aurea]|uniref:glycosyltransferase family 2 protein n=1 Tax=Methylocapsa aurea TaxID=663610 RepID=UPI003D18F90B
MVGKEMKISLPLVSIVIANYNYGRFLTAAVESVKNQTYPNIECIIVDDASTDDSPAQIERIAATFPEVTCIRNDENSGQTFSFYAGFKQSRGDFVLFLDADDILLENAITTHIFVHLSSRIRAGFTTCDWLQTLDERLMAGAFFPLELLEYHEPRNSGLGLLHRLDKSCTHIWPPNVGAPPDDLARRVFYMPPSDAARKIFAPTSGNCFRRDALALFLDESSPMDLRLNADVYLREAVFLITGAIGVDMPLFVYRIHGSNGFSKCADLVNRIAIDPAKDLMTRKIANRAIADRLAGNAQYFLKNFGYLTLFEALHALLVDVHLAAPSDLGALTGYLHAQLRDNESTIVSFTSRADFERLLFRLEVAPKRDRSPLQKKIAEFFLTIGRLTRSSELTNLGERFWRA